MRDAALDQPVVCLLAVSGIDSGGTKGANVSFTVDDQPDGLAFDPAGFGNSGLIGLPEVVG